MTTANKKENPFLKYILMIIICAATCGATIWFYAQKTSVTLVGLHDPVEYRLDLKDDLLLTQTGYYEFKRPLNNISPGTHLIHYDVSPVTRYYAPIDVQKGDNYIKPVFNYHSLPALSIHRAYALGSIKQGKTEKEFNYTTFTGDKKKKNNTVRISLGLKINPIPDMKKLLAYEYEWNVSLNGVVIGKDRFILKGHISDKTKHGKKIILYEDVSYRYYADYYFMKGTARLKIGSEYL